MKCEKCKKNEASIHLTQVMNGKVKKLNLCQECAMKNGIDLNAPISITDILMGLGVEGKDLPGGEEMVVPELDLSCSRCSMTRSEFKKRARLGCPECYNAFMGELGALTKAMHHSTQHVGKIPACQGAEARVAAQVATLKKELETAIVKENYEQAAVLRDQINALRLEDSEVVHDD